MTTSLLIVLLILLGVVPLFLKEKRELAMMVRFGLVAMALLLVVVRWIAAPPEPLEGSELFNSSNWAAGWRLGKAVTEDFPDGGRVGVLVSSNPSEGLAQMADEQVEGLREGLKKGDFELEVYRPDGHARAIFTDMPDADAVGAFVDQAQGTVAIVSFTSFPFRRMEDQEIPPVYVLDLYGSGYWKGWMRAGKVAVAAFPHKNFARMNNANLQHGNPEERFGSVYDLVTPDSLDP